MKQPKRSIDQTRGCQKLVWIKLLTLALALALATPAVQAQSSGTQNQQAPAKPQSTDDIPDAPSTVQPPAPKPAQSIMAPSGADQTAPPRVQEQKPAPPPMPPVQTIPPGSMPEATAQGSGPRNQVNPAEDLYKLRVTTNFVQIPALVKYKDGRRVEGLLPSDFEVFENGKPQKLTYFTSDPFQLSVAILLDLSMPDVTMQKVNETYASLVGAFSPYDEYALYTYSSTVSQVADFTSKPARLTAVLDQMKLVRGYNNGPPVLGGPLGPEPPMVNGIPIGSSGPPPVITPPKEAHVLNDAILRAALDLSKRDRTRRKIIFVISDGRERGSQSSYRQVLKVLETHGIQVKAVVLDTGALPVYKQVEKIHHVFDQGYADILPKYVSATGGGKILTELSRNSIENAYAEITADARNQYTLGYSPKAIAGGSAYRNIEVRVLGHGTDLNIYTKAGYYPIPSAR